MYDLILAIVKCIETNVILHYTRTQIIIIIIIGIKEKVEPQSEGKCQIFKGHMQAIKERTGDLDGYTNYPT